MQENKQKKRLQTALKQFEAEFYEIPLMGWGATTNILGSARVPLD